jgi:hypothetical protein
MQPGVHMKSAGCLSLFSQCQIFFPWKWRLHTGDLSLPRDGEIVNKQQRQSIVGVGTKFTKAAKNQKGCARRGDQKIAADACLEK